MKYMIMLFGSQQDYDAFTGKETPKAMPPEQIEAMHKHMIQLHNDLADSGELVDAKGLTAPVYARRVQLSGGAPVVTDGPYAETQEVLAGYTIVDCVSLDRATQIAARFVNPDAEGEYVDIRPIVDGFEDLEH
ncbi:MAG: hypothetical protein HOV79_18910 [Hamadaea sp.]|nr:hypothetical protein [Hamadaea sp.]